MGLAQRIKKLERTRGSDACPNCGLSSGPKGMQGVRISIPAPEVIDRLNPVSAAERARERPEDFCRSCGRQTVFRVPSPMLRGAEW
jgi:hypothetical protein